jgi:hypothetical protein
MPLPGSWISVTYLLKIKFKALHSAVNTVTRKEHFTFIDKKFAFFYLGPKVAYSYRLHGIKMAWAPLSYNCELQIVAVL